MGCTLYTCFLLVKMLRTKKAENSNVLQCKLRVSAFLCAKGVHYEEWKIVLRILLQAENARYRVFFLNIKSIALI